MACWDRGEVRNYTTVSEVRVRVEIFNQHLGDVFGKISLPLP
jgi:hypothetical protein